MIRYALTTFDNPFDPFDDFVNWFLFDTEMGYNSCSLLARMSNSDEGLSEIEKQNQLSTTIDRIIELDFRNVYKKVEQNR